MGGVECGERERGDTQKDSHQEILQFEISVANKTSLSLLEHVSVDSNSPILPQIHAHYYLMRSLQISLLCSVVFDSASLHHTHERQTLTGLALRRDVPSRDVSSTPVLSGSDVWRDDWSFPMTSYNRGYGRSSSNNRRYGRGGGGYGMGGYGDYGMMGGYGGGYGMGGYGGGVSGQSRVRYKTPFKTMCCIFVYGGYGGMGGYGGYGGGYGGYGGGYGGYGRGGYGGGYGLGYSNMNNFPETREWRARRSTDMEATAAEDMEDTTAEAATIKAIIIRWIGWMKDAIRFLYHKFETIRNNNNMIRLRSKPVMGMSVDEDGEKFCREEGSLLWDGYSLIVQRHISA
eukprot:scaffold35799_cov161-Skeletonema_dohrnii-CCMP3373.AAC.1